MDLLWYRRINWRVETRHRIRQSFERISKASREADYPFRLYVAEYDQPNEGTVQISSGHTPIGAVNRKSEFSFEYGQKHDDSPVMEKGGSLVASQSVTGHIHFVVYLNESDRIKFKKNNILLMRRFDPTEVTQAVIDKAVRRYLLCIRSSSVYGQSDSLSVTDHLRMMLIRAQDSRFKYSLIRSLLSLQNEWGKAIVTGLIALLVGYIAAKKT